ncbi:MAG: DUF4333 domain-containing protein [Solirubrobacterales bacterium]
MAVALAACGGDDDGFDTDRLTKQLAELYTARTDVQPTSVSCPDDIDGKAGETFTCKAELPNRDKRDMDVKLLDDRGALTYELGDRTQPE